MPRASHGIACVCRFLPADGAECLTSMWELRCSLIHVKQRVLTGTHSDEEARSDQPWTSTHEMAAKWNLRSNLCSPAHRALQTPANRCTSGLADCVSPHGLLRDRLSYMHSFHVNHTTRLLLRFGGASSDLHACRCSRCKNRPSYYPRRVRWNDDGKARAKRAPTQCADSRA